MINSKFSSRLWLLAGVLATVVSGADSPAWSQTAARRTTPAKSVTGQAPLALNKVLVFSKTAGYRHASINVGKLAIMKLGKENGFAVDTTEDAGKFTENNLKQYSAVIWLSTTGNVLDEAQQAAV